MTDKFKKIHIIYVVEEGYSCLTCGVGTIALHFLYGFSEIEKKFLLNNIKLKLSIITISSSSNSIGYSPHELIKAKDVCSKFGGSLFEIFNERKLGEDYFNPTLWKYYNQKAINIVENIINSYDGNFIVISNDTIFAHTFSLNLKVINLWIPHSFSFSHKQSYINEFERFKWENEAIQRIKENDNFYIGSISSYCQHLIQKYFSLTNKKIISIYNGFYFPLLNVFKQSQLKLQKYLAQRDIPVDRDIIFSYARADEYKGLDIALNSMIKISESCNLYPILIASKYSEENSINSIQQSLIRISQKNKIYKSVFLGYEFELPKKLVQFKRTKFLLNLPTNDLSPLAPYESELLGHKDLCVLKSNIPCFTYNNKNQKTDYLCNPEVKYVLLKVKRIMSLTEKMRREISEYNKKIIKQNMNIVYNYYYGLNNVINSK